jgi:hypothetical protein
VKSIAGSCQTFSSRRALDFGTAAIDCQLAAVEELLGHVLDLQRHDRRAFVRQGERMDHAFRFGHLHQQFAEALHDLAPAHLDHRNLRPRRLARKLVGQNAIGGIPQGEQIGFGLGHALSQNGVRAALAPVRPHLLQPRPHLAGERHVDADPRAHQAFVAEQELGDVPRSALAPDQVGHGHPHVLDLHLVDRVHAAKRVDRTDGDPRLLHVDQQERDAGLLRPFGRGAYQAEDLVAEVGVARPQLGSGNDVIVAIAHRAHLQVGKIRTSLRFRESLAPPIFARQDARQQLGLLLGRAEFDQHRSEEILRNVVEAGRPRQPRFLFPDQPLHRAPAGTAMLLWPQRHVPALGPQQAVPVDVLILGQLLAGQRLARVLRRQIVGEERAQFRPERRHLIVDQQVHGR